MHQSTTPSLSQTIWPRWASTQFLSLPTVQTLLPVTFDYSLSSRKNLEAVVMRKLRRWKWLWRRSLTRSHKRSSMGPSGSCWNGTSALQPERLLQRGLEFHVCTINKSAHTKKNLETYWRPLVYRLLCLGIKCSILVMEHAYNHIFVCVCVNVLNIYRLLYL